MRASVVAKQDNGTDIVHVSVTMLVGQTHTENKQTNKQTSKLTNKRIKQTNKTEQNKTKQNKKVIIYNNNHHNRKNI